MREAQLAHEAGRTHHRRWAFRPALGFIDPTLFLLPNWEVCETLEFGASQPIEGFRKKPGRSTPNWLPRLDLHDFALYLFKRALGIEATAAIDRATQMIPSRARHHYQLLNADRALRQLEISDFNLALHRPKALRDARADVVDGGA